MQKSVVILQVQVLFFALAACQGITMNHYDLEDLEGAVLPMESPF